MPDRVVKQYGDDVKDRWDTFPQAWDELVSHIFLMVLYRSSLRQIFATNLGYAGCATPLVEVSKGNYHPAVNSRYISSVVPHHGSGFRLTYA